MNNRDVGGLRCHRDHYDVIVMAFPCVGSVTHELSRTDSRNKPRISPANRMFPAVLINSLAPGRSD